MPRGAGAEVLMSVFHDFEELSGGAAGFLVHTTGRCGTEKPAGVLGASIGVIGTAMAQQHLRNILAYLDVPTLGQPEAFIHVKDGLFDEAGNISADTKLFLQNWMDRYVAWVKKHSA